jgi:hypothetical protein
MVTLAPTDDDEPTEATRFDSTAWAARLFGVHTKAAITATKARGTKVDGNRGVKPTVKMRTKSAAASQQRASASADNIVPPIAELQADGATSLRQIAAGLNAKDIPTARGEGAWTAPRVKRVLKRLVR